jgi:hypothetical protein
MPTIAPTARDIGPPPADLQEVQIAEPVEGENAFVIAKRALNALDLANYRICKLRGEWVRVRIDHLAGSQKIDPPAECQPPEDAAPKPAPAKKAKWKLRGRA